MPAQHLRTGFYGKLPAAGDFVTRGLDPAFVRRWDRFVAAHLAPTMTREPLDDHPILRFTLDEAGTVMAGCVMASADLVGRAFPLTIAAPTTMAEAGDGSDWFSAAEELGDAARCGELLVDELDDMLRRLPLPPAFPARCDASFWIGGGSPEPIDLLAPGSGLTALLAQVRTVVA